MRWKNEAFLIAYLLSNITIKNLQNWFMCVNIMANQNGGTFLIHS